MTDSNEDYAVVEIDVAKYVNHIVTGVTKLSPQATMVRHPTTPDQIDQDKNREKDRVATVRAEEERLAQLQQQQDSDLAAHKSAWSDEAWQAKILTILQQAIATVESNFDFVGYYTAPSVGVKGIDRLVSTELDTNGDPGSHIVLNEGSPGAMVVLCTAYSWDEDLRWGHPRADRDEVHIGLDYWIRNDEGVLRNVEGYDTFHVPPRPLPEEQENVYGTLRKDGLSIEDALSVSAACLA